MGRGKAARGRESSSRVRRSLSTAKLGLRQPTSEGARRQGGMEEGGKEGGRRERGGREEGERGRGHGMREREREGGEGFGVVRGEGEERGHDGAHFGSNHSEHSLGSSLDRTGGFERLREQCKGERGWARARQEAAATSTLSNAIPDSVMTEQRFPRLSDH
eukprot:1533152-Rhodomonas_salina.1